MSKHGKATLILVTLPVLAMAQSAPSGPASQPHPAAPIATPAPQAAQSPAQKWFVPNQNFYKAAPRPQPSAPVPADMRGGANHSGAAVVTAPRSAPVMQPPVMQPPMRPAVVSAPAMQSPQAAPAVMQGSGAPVAAAPGPRATVDYASGRLSVVADNAPLGLVLKLIAEKTGATVDLAPDLQNEPVVAHLGPAAVSDVLPRLLDSPRVDYIVFGTGDQPGSLQRIVVRTRHSFGHIAMTGPVSSQPQGAAGEAVQNPNGPATAMTPQSMENWQKVREEMRQAEIRQQAEDREREKTQPVEPPVAQNNPEPEPLPQDNPPQR